MAYTGININPDNARNYITLKKFQSFSFFIIFFLYFCKYFV